METIKEMAAALKTMAADIKQLKEEKSGEGRQWLDTAAAAKYLGISVSKLYKMTAKNEIPHYKPSGQLLFSVNELSEYIKACRIATKEEIEHKATKAAAKLDN